MASMSDHSHKHPHGYSLFGPVLHTLALSITLYNFSFVNWKALLQRKPVPVLVLLSIVFTSFGINSLVLFDLCLACISQIIQHTPFCEGENPNARFQQKLVCSQVLDIAFSIFDAFMALTVSYGMISPG